MYCSTLLRPGFCPFCVGDKTLDASCRLESWTRENQLRSHIESHLRKAHWPCHCPFPLCNIRLTDETSFLYHLNDVHGFRMHQRLTPIKREESDTHPFVLENTGTGTRKRKTEDDHSQEVGLSSGQKVNFHQTASPQEPSKAFSFREQSIRRARIDIQRATIAFRC